MGPDAGLLGSYRWDWKELRAALPGLAVAWIPDVDGDLIGPGVAIDETAQLKHGDATVWVAPQHAGCTGKVENCVTTVFSAYVTADGQAWADFDVYMPDRWARDFPRRRAAGVRVTLQFAAKPQLAMNQLGRLTAAGLPVSGPRSTRSTAAARNCARRPRFPMWRSSRATTRSPCRPARRSGLTWPSRTRYSSGGPAGTGPRDPATATGR